jgi:predicted protein tyrosine phosphatase
MNSRGLNMINVLFICTKNQWRSPTAEKVYEKHPLISVRSAGTSTKARRHVSVADIEWAKVVFVMEHKHKQRIRADFPDLMKYKELHILDIPDEYKFMDPELIEMIEDAVDPILNAIGF